VAGCSSLISASRAAGDRQGVALAALVPPLLLHPHLQPGNCRVSPVFVNPPFSQPTWWTVSQLVGQWTDSSQPATTPLGARPASLPVRPSINKSSVQWGNVPRGQ
jgi:hypothetical protein